MAAIIAGKEAPVFQLPLLTGGSFSLRDALTQGPVVLAFFKISCPVCQFTFPYLERIHRAANGKNVAIVGVSQNSKEDSAAFAREYDLTFPIALDDTRKYPVSNSYGITNVPTIFYIAPDREIEVSSVGWSKDDLQAIAGKISEQVKLGNIEVIQSGEDVPSYKAG
jgi:peroxiredoxin